MPSDWWSQFMRRAVPRTLRNASAAKFTINTMEKFIACVRMHQCLWNPQHPDYSDVHVRGHAWQNVIKEFDDSSIPNIKAARTEWRKLRDNHREALKRAKLGQNKLLPAQITTWKYAKAMQFLEPHMKYRITENIEMDPPPTTTKSADHDVSTTIAVDNMKTENLNKRRCTECSEGPSAKLRNDQNTDALESFYNCILKTTRDMPHWMQTQVKKKIFAIIIEAEEKLSAQEHSAGAEDYDSSFLVETKIKTEFFNDTIVGD